MAKCLPIKVVHVEFQRGRQQAGTWALFAAILPNRNLSIRPNDATTVEAERAARRPARRKEASSSSIFQTRLSGPAQKLTRTWPRKCLTRRGRRRANQAAQKQMILTQSHASRATPPADGKQRDESVCLSGAQPEGNVEIRAV